MYMNISQKIRVMFCLKVFFLLLKKNLEQLVCFRHFSILKQNLLVKM